MLSFHLLFQYFCFGNVCIEIIATLLNTTQSLGRLRKQFHAYRGSRVLVTYHPAYLLRTPSAKRHVWDDMKMLRDRYVEWGGKYGTPTTVAEAATAANPVS